MLQVAAVGVFIRACVLKGLITSCHAHSCCSTLGPPDVNKAMVEESHKTATRLHRQLEELHNKFLVQLQNIQEVVNMACVNEVERHRVKPYNC